jgi:hypothetical protein
MPPIAMAIDRGLPHIPSDRNWLTGNALRLDVAVLRGRGANLPICDIRRPEVTKLANGGRSVPTCKACLREKSQPQIMRW